MKIFWILLILVVLFIVGSASALHYIDARSMRRQKDQQNNTED